MALNTIDAKMLAKMFLAGAKNLESKKELINELNVFPVPDGDTGTNMTLTIMSAAKEVVALGEEPDMTALCKAISGGSLRGARGKSGSNDANAEYLARLRRIFDDNKVAFQTAELGKVDYGGGGTIAYIAALYGMEVVDSGVAVLSMHAPWEIISKSDLYEAKKGYVAFLKNA